MSDTHETHQHMDPESQRYLDILEEIDSRDHEVTKWEADFIVSVLRDAERKGSSFIMSGPRKGVIDRMRDTYL